MSKRTAVLTKEGKKYVLFLLENEKPSKQITIQTEEEEIAEFTLKNRLGFPIEKATYSMVAKGSVLLPKASTDESEGYEVTESEFDTANGETSFWFGCSLLNLFNLFTSISPIMSLANNLAAAPCFFKYLPPRRQRQKRSALPWLNWSSLESATV